ncbi:MAG: GNAT family N-acetyltransferase, partial [Candidatus Omnitrophica bacterium]|nr:GNAT family N-acetyltransferase [Candidatus Omnitrophota bacterium]
MKVIDKQLYLKIAEDVAVFTKDEIDGIAETLDWYIEEPEKEFFLVEERDGDNLMGFAMFGRTPITTFSWDIYWLLVSKHYQGKGIGKRLLNKLEERILSMDKKAVLRVETSTKREVV